MNEIHRQYLQEMGIDVWSLRPDKPPHSVAVVAAESHTEPVQLSASITPQVSGAAASLALVRGVTKDVSAIKAQKASPIEKTTLAESQIADAPTFLFCFLDYDQFSFLFSLPLNSDSLPGNYRYFADDVYLALTGQRSIPKIRDLRWPMVQSSHIPQTAADAELVVLQKVRQCADKLLVFGEDPANYLDQTSSLVKDKQIVAIKDAEFYFSQPEAKRSLWRRIKDLRSEVAK